MADFYKDTDTGSDANDGTTWAQAKLTQEGQFAVMSAGDNGFAQGAAADTAAIDRTLASPGTVTNPCKIIGVAIGTTAEPPTVSDLAVTLPVISTTGATADINFTGSTSYFNIHLSTGDRGSTAVNQVLEIVNGKFSLSDRFVVGTQSIMRLINCIYEPLTTTGISEVPNDGLLEFLGGSYLATAQAPILRSVPGCRAEFTGFDMSGLGATALSETNSYETTVKNCPLPPVLTLYTVAPTLPGTRTFVISSSDINSVPATDSIQDYMYEDAYGTIDAEFTVVRTGGADDGASGAFSYAMTPRADSTLESSSATLISPWMVVWVEAGSQTLTVFIANSSASTDYNEDEVWVEFYSPDSADTAQHEQNFDPGNARLFASSTAITDDTGSTWGTGGNNHQKLSVSVTPGFEGPAYARLHLAKRQATPDTLYLDPVIEIS